MTELKHDEQQVTLTCAAGEGEAIPSPDVSGVEGREQHSTPDDQPTDASREQPATIQEPEEETNNKAEASIDTKKENLWRGAAMSKEERAAFNKEMQRKFLEYARAELLSHAVPLVVLAAIIICPPLMIAWVPFVLLWWAAELIYKRLGPNQKLRIKRLIPDSWLNSRIFLDLSDGMLQVRPFVLASLYIFCIPFALIWMYSHWILQLNRSSKKESNDLALAPARNEIKFLQNQRNTEEEEEANFIHSPAFPMTCAFLFVSGIPAILTYFLYQYLGIDAILGFPSLNPKFTTAFLITGLYIGSIAWCGSVLFFRSWFTFPLNFSGEEEEIELSGKGVRREFKSWFTQVLTMNSPWAGAQALDWQAIKELRLDLSNTPFYPLPQTAFSSNSFIYNLLNQLALIIDGLHKNAQKKHSIYFTTNSADRATTTSTTELGLHFQKSNRNIDSFIRVDLSQLSGDERAQLYYAVRKWAPHIVIDEGAQEELMGSTVLQVPAYTQLWFELLAGKMPPRAASVLPPGTKLQNGSITVNERLSSGGQANIYHAELADGGPCVLKEFILSTSDAVGALLESAGEFEMEATLLSELKHSRIIEMKSFFAESRRLYIVLEKIDGNSLRQLIKESKTVLSEQETIAIALQVCDVLQYLHEQEPPVVHRDISPDNIMFNRAEGVKVIDFSLAAAKKSRRTTSTMGKHSYAPPEQFRDQPCPQSDIYGLGATMYFLLTGEDPKPIAASDVSRKRNDVSESLNGIIKRATAFNLEDRYPETQWLKLDLEAALAESQKNSANQEPETKL